MSNNLKMVQHTAYLQWRPIESRVWSIELHHFQWPWTTPTPSFKVTPFFDAEHLINGATYRHSLNEIPLGTYSRPTQLYHFEFDLEWLSKIFNDTKRRAVSLLQLSLLLSVGVTWVNNTGFCSVARLARVTFLCFSKLLHSVIVIIPQSVSSKFHF